MTLFGEQKCNFAFAAVHDALWIVMQLLYTTRIKKRNHNNSAAFCKKHVFT
jgi:hypothetical protein